MNTEELQKKIQKRSDTYCALKIDKIIRALPTKEPYTKAGHKGFHEAFQLIRPIKEMIRSKVSYATEYNFYTRI